MLGASPDGLISRPSGMQVHYQDGAFTDPPTVLEVKCPFSAKDMTILEAVQMVKGFYIGKIFNLFFRLFS